VTAVLAAAMTAGASGLAQASPAPARIPLPGSAVPFTSHTPVMGFVAGGQRLTVQLWLKPDIAGAERYAIAAVTPGSALSLGKNTCGDPVLYKLYRTNAYHRTLPLTSHSPALQRATFCSAAICKRNVLVTFDDQSPAITSQVTLPGYDNMTGLGTPNGPAFIHHRRQLAG